MKILSNNNKNLIKLFLSVFFFCLFALLFLRKLLCNCYPDVCTAIIIYRLKNKTVIYKVDTYGKWLLKRVITKRKLIVICFFSGRPHKNSI